MSVAYDTPYVYSKVTNTYINIEESVESAHSFDYKEFEFYIVGLISEYINDIEQYSYENLSDDWWYTLYKQIMNPVEQSENYFGYNLKSIESITMMILDKVLAELPADFMTIHQKEEFADQIEIAVRAFYKFTDVFD